MRKRIYKWFLIVVLVFLVISSVFLFADSLNLYKEQRLEYLSIKEIVAGEAGIPLQYKGYLESILFKMIARCSFFFVSFAFYVFYLIETIKKMHHDTKNEKSDATSLRN